MKVEGAVAFSQKVSCSPHTTVARSTGSQASGMESIEKGLFSRRRCSSVRSCGSKATERASKARVKAAHTRREEIERQRNQLGREQVEGRGHQPIEGLVSLGLPGPAGGLGDLEEASQRNPVVEGEEINREKRRRPAAKAGKRERTS